jgi:hypothetical protein
MAAISKGPVNKGGLNQFTFSLETPSLSSGTLDKYLKSVLGEDSGHTIPDLLKPIQSSGDVRQQDDASSLDDKHSPVSTIPINASSNVSSGHSMMGVSQNAPHVPTNMVHPSSVGQDLALQGQDNSHGGQQLATTNDSNELIPVPRGQNYVDITEYLNMPQADAAKKLGIPPSTLSKRWKEAVRKRKWPYRMICKIDKEIMTLLHNVPQGPNAPPLPEEIETALGISLRKRQEELRPVVIRI